MTNYPPIVESSIPAFPYNDSIDFYFQFPSTIGTRKTPNYYIDIKISDAQTNKIVHRNTMGEILGDAKEGFYVKIPQFAKMGIIYKIQLRLVGKSIQDRGQYSEWSTVCYAKATAKKQDIILSILNYEEDGNVQFIESPVFMGQFISPDETEPETYYCFTLTDNIGNIVETTGWLPHIEAVDTVVFSQGLNDFSSYILQYEVQTKNKYYAFNKYEFVCSFSLLDNPNMSISGTNNFEEGCIDLHLISDDRISTNVILRRTDSRSNYQIWEDYKIFNVLDSIMDIHFKDLIVENGVKYQYGIQIIQDNKYRAALIKSEPILSEYEYTYLVGDECQLKIKFNSTINALKRTLQETKTDTIGSKYPFIVRNGNINYFTFPVNGLISYHVDEAEMFCKKADLTISDAYDFNSHVNLTNDNIVFEREFRTKVEEFLTNGKYKYYKSPTEGVFLIALMGVSLSPEKALGRMIYSFSATAYEINDVSLSSVLSYGLISSGSYQEVHEMGVKEIPGTISLRTLKDQDLYRVIAEKVYEDNTTYERVLHHLNYLSIEITNLSSVQQNGYPIFIKDQNNNSIKIIISKELGYYELNKVFDIYGLIASTQANIDMNIKYIAVCQYNSKENSKPNLDKYHAVSNFYQLYGSFTENQDIIATIVSEARLFKIINLTYLRLDGLAGTKIEVDGNVYMLDDGGSIEIKNQKITSVKILTPGVASISVIYNGFE